MKGHYKMSKTETISVEQDAVDKQLISLIDKNIVEISKYGEKVLIKPYDILYIPFGWYYYQEINKPVLLYHVDVDNYFTYIHNTILNKF